MLSWRLRRLGARTLRVAMGSALGLLAGEGVMRLGGFDPLDDPQVAAAANSWTQDCAELVDGPGYRLAPDRCGANRFGLLDEDRPFVGGDQEVRIAVVGDSITGDRMYTDFLEALLTPALHRPVAAFNFGVPGYSTEEEAWTVEHAVPASQPAAIVLQFTPNDYQGTPVYLRHGSSVVVVDGVRADPNPVTRALVLHSAAWRVFALRRGLRPGVEERAPVIHAALDRIVAAADGAPLFALVFPTLTAPESTPASDVWATEDFVEAAHARGFRVVDLRETFRAVPAEDLRMDAGPTMYAQLATRQLRVPLPALIRATPPASLRLVDTDRASDTVHPNFYGHALAATALADAMTPVLP
jgi:hypothetical protein